MADAATVSVLLSAKDEASAKLKTVGDNMGRLGQNFQKHGKAIGLGLVGMGAGIEALAQQQQALTESTRKLGFQTGMTEGEIRKMATGLSNATFPLQSAIDLMMLGARQGLEGADALKEYATFWDMVGDATGGSAEKMAEMGAALAALGVEVGEESQLLQAFGLIQTTTTGSVQDFIKTVSMLAPELALMGLSVNDVAVILTAMERELGLVGRVAKAEFKLAVDQTKDGLAGVLEILGLTEAQLEKYRLKLEESGDVMLSQADIYAGTMTKMDELKSTMADLAFANGALIEKAAALAPLLIAIGPAVAGATMAWSLLEPVIFRARLAFIGLNLSMGVIAAVVIGISLAITAAILVWKNWDRVVEIAKKGLALFVKSSVEWIKIWLEAAKAIVSWIPGLDGVEDKIQSAIKTLDGFSDTADRWASDSGSAVQSVADDWVAMEDQHHTVANAVENNNEWMSSTTNQLAERTKESAGTIVQSTEQIAQSWADTEDAMVVASGGILKSLDDLQREHDTHTYLMNLSTHSRIDAREAERQKYIDGVREANEASRQRQEQEARTVAQISSSWDSYRTSQDATIKELKAAQMNFADVVETLAVQHGVSTAKMADDLAVAGVRYGDTMGLIEQVGRNAIGNVISEFGLVAGAASAAAESAKMSWKEAMEAGVGFMKMTTDQKTAAFAEGGSELETEFQKTKGKQIMLSVGSGHRSFNIGTGRTTVAGAMDVLRERQGQVANALGMARADITDEVLKDVVLGNLGLGERLAAQGFAKGGIVTRPTLGLVGEAGPEAIIPLGRGGGMGTTNNFHFHGAVYGVEDLKEAVVEAVRDHAISGGFSGVFAEA